MADATTQLESPDGSAAADPSGQSLLCPRCGYDLRGATSDRCSECGQEIDRAALSESGFPWAHQKRLGRIYAFLSTVWLVSFDSRRIRLELSKPQELSDARWFRFWLVLILSILGGGAIGVVILEYGVAELLLQPKRAGDGGLSQFFPTPLPGWHQDLEVPWFAGVSLFWLVPAYVILQAIYFTGIARASMHISREDPGRRGAARAIGLYAAAPLVLLVISLFFYFASHVLAEIDWRNGGTEEQIASLRKYAQIAAMVWTGIVLLLAFRRAGQWITRAHHSGVVRFSLGVAEGLARGAVGIIICCGVIPWCCGLIRIMAKSLP